MGSANQSKSRRNKWLLIALAPVLALAGGGGWLAGSASGLQWLAGVIEHQSKGGFKANGLSGTLLGQIGMRQLVVRGEGWRVILQDVQLQFQPIALLIGELKVPSLSARQIEILSLPSDTPLAVPGSLGLPIDVSVKQMNLGTLSLLSREGAAPDFIVKDIEGGLEIDARHLQLRSLRARLPYGELAGSGDITFRKPYLLNVQASLDASTQLSGKSVRAHFIAEAGGDLQHIGVKFDGNGEGMKVNGAAQIEPFSGVPIMSLRFAFSGMNPGMLFEGGPHAVLSGNVDLHGKAGGELEGSLQVRNAQAAPLNRNGLPLSAATAQVRLSESNWQLQQLDARLQNDGQISGTVSLAGLGSRVNAQLKVQQLDPAALDTRLPSAHLHGDITLEGLGTHQKAAMKLSDDKLEIHAELERQGARLELTGVRVIRGDTVLTGNGQLTMDRRRTFHFFSQLRKLDLSEFADVPSTELNAGLEASGTLLPEVGGTVRIHLSGSRFAQQNIYGNGHIEFSGMEHAAAEVALGLGENHLKLEVEHDTKSDRAELTLDAPNLAQLGNGLGGRLAGHAELSGSLVTPRLQFSAHGTNLMLPGGQRASAIDATGDLASAAMKMSLGMKGYRGTGTLNMTDASVELQGSKEHHTVQISARIAQGDDELSELTLKAKGGLNDSARGWQFLQWRGELDELEAQGVLPFHLLNTVPLSLARDSIQLGTADVTVAGGQIHFSDMQWAPQRWHSAGRFSGLNVRAVNMLQIKPLSGTIQPMRFGGEWDATLDEHLHGTLQVQRESGDWVVDGNNGLQLGLSELHLSLSAGQDQLHAQLDASGEHLGEVKLKGDVPLKHTDTGWTIMPDAPLAGHLLLQSDDLSWLGPMLDNNLQSGGRLNIDANLIGTLLSPRLAGMAQGDNLSLSLLDKGVRLEKGEIKARFDPESVNIDRLAFSAPYTASPRDKLFGDFKIPAGTGQLSASGRIDLEGGKTELQITAERVPLLQRTDRWIIASGTGHARYANNTLMLDGKIRADAGLINQPVSDRPRWSEDVQVTGRETASRPGPPISVEASLDFGDHFYIRASGLEGRLAGQLKVHGEPGNPLLMTGTIAAQDAVFEAYGQRLQVERGMVNFQGPLDDPGLNILALRKGLDVEAGVEVTGTVRRPTVRLVSTPNVPDGEKLSWIVLGRVPDSEGVDSALLLAAAGSILGGQSVGKIGQTLGIDEISLSQETGEGSQQINKVTVGKQLSARARISYEQDLSAVGGITKFTFTLTPRITIVTRTGTEDALDVFYTFRFY
jgi:translocation and assembly module TamB